MIICKRSVDPDDHMQEASWSRWLFAIGQSIRIIICKRSFDPDGHLQKADRSSWSVNQDDHLHLSIVVICHWSLFVICCFYCLLSFVVCCLSFVVVCHLSLFVICLFFRCLLFVVVCCGLSLFVVWTPSLFIFNLWYIFKRRQILSVIITLLKFGHHYNTNVILTNFNTCDRDVLIQICCLSRRGICRPNTLYQGKPGGDCNTDLSKNRIWKIAFTWYSSNCFWPVLAPTAPLSPRHSQYLSSTVIESSSSFHLPLWSAPITLRPRTLYSQFDVGGSSVSCWLRRKPADSPNKLLTYQWPSKVLLKLLQSEGIKLPKPKAPKTPLVSTCSRRLVTLTVLVPSLRPPSL